MKQDTEKLLKKMLSYGNCLDNPEELEDVYDNFIKIIAATAKFNEGRISSKGEAVFKEAIRGKVQVNGKPLVRHVLGLSGSGKSHYIKKFCAANNNFIPFLMDDINMLAGLDMLYEFMPVRLNNNEIKHPSLCTAMALFGMLNPAEKLEEVSGIEDFTKCSVFGKMQYMSYALLNSKEYNYNLMRETNLTSLDELFSKKFESSYSERIDLVVVPDIIREANVLHRYEKSLAEHAKFLSMGTKNPQFVNGSCIPQFSNYLPKQKNQFGILLNIPRFCRKKKIPLSIINPVSGNIVNNVRVETERPLNAKEKIYLEELKSKIDDFQKARNASAYYRACLRALDRRS